VACFPVVRTSRLLWLVLAGAAVLPRPPGVPLTRRRVRVPGPADAVYDRMAAFDDGPRVLERTADHVVAEFPVRAGWYRGTTLERVTLDPSRRRLVFEQLRRPFPGVGGAIETFELTPLWDGATLVSLDGTISPSLGLLGWLVTRWLVRPHWDKIDAAYLERVRLAFAGPSRGC
jgi:hypothetical protein